MGIAQEHLRGLGAASRASMPDDFFRLTTPRQLVLKKDSLPSAFADWYRQGASKSAPPKFFEILKEMPTNGARIYAGHPCCFAVTQSDSPD